MAGEIRTVGVLGGGLMGTGIAETAVRAGFPVCLFEPVEEHRAASAARLGHERIRVVDRADELADCDLIVEAIVEDERVKLDWFGRLDDLARADALLASNTSSIPIARLAGAVRDPSRVLGLHFFSPAPVMRLVEVVSGLRTGEEALERATAFVRALDKQPIASKDRAGFIVNLLLVPYLVAAVRMLEEGFADREAIDSGMKLGCGHPMGPLQLCDFIGLDVVDAVCESLHAEFKRAEYAPPPLLKRMVEAGWLGRKAGRGFYEYDEPGVPVRPRLVSA